MKISINLPDLSKLKVPAILAATPFGAVFAVYVLAHFIGAMSIPFSGDTMQGLLIAGAIIGLLADLFAVVALLGG